MLKLNNAPEKGTIYATFVNKMVFKKYESLEEIKAYLTTDNLLELHLFDTNKELRFIRTRDKGVQSYLIPGDTKYEDEYVEELYISGENIDKQDDLTEKIKVINYIKYDENDMIHIVNYRLTEVE